MLTSKPYSSTDAENEFERSEALQDKADSRPGSRGGTSGSSGPAAASALAG